VIQGDHGIDIIATYKKNTILIQCKKVEKAITVQIVKNFESSISRFSNPLGIIVYEKEHIKSNNFITKTANSWLINSDFQIKVCNETQVVKTIEEFFSIEPEKKDFVITNYKADEFNLEEFGITSKNVSIGKMVIRNNKKSRYSPML
jgi:hypothetical protein